MLRLIHVNVLIWFVVYHRRKRITGGDVPPCLSGATAVMLDSEHAMYLIGGHSYTGKVNSVYRLNVLSGHWLCTEDLEPEDNFSPRDKFAAWEFNNKFVVNAVLF